MKIITALGNPKTNEKLKKEKNFEVIGNDIQYKEGIIEILEKNLKIDLIIISEILPGENEFKEIIEKIISINNKIEIIVVLKEENNEIKNYLISKGIFNIFYNNKITNDELIKIIKEIENIKKENEMNEEIKKLKNIILEKEREKIVNKKIKDKYLKIKNKILNKYKTLNKYKKRNKIENKEESKIISIVRNKWNRKKHFISTVCKTKSK